MRVKDFCYGLVLACLIATVSHAEPSGSPGRAGLTPSPHAPGTKEYYGAYVQGRYALRDGKMVLLVPPPGVRRAGQPATPPQFLKGVVSQALDGSNIVLVTQQPYPSGAPKYSSHIVSVPDSEAMPVGEDVRLCATPDGEYICVTEAGVTNQLPGYRLVPTITFDEYMSVYSAESKEPERIASFQRPKKTAKQATVELLEARRADIRRRGGRGAAMLDKREVFEAFLKEYQPDIIEAGGVLGPRLTRELDERLGILPPGDPTEAKKEPANNEIQPTK